MCAVLKNCPPEPQIIISRKILRQSQSARAWRQKIYFSLGGSRFAAFVSCQFCHISAAERDGDTLCARVQKNMKTHLHNDILIANSCCSSGTCSKQSKEEPLPLLRLVVAIFNACHAVAGKGDGYYFNLNRRALSRQ